MPKLLYASSGHDSDMFYAVRLEIPDAFFYLDTGSRKLVFLDHREYGVFKEHNKNKNIELVLLNPLIDKAAKRKEAGNTVSKLALLLLERYGLLKKQIEVPASFPLDMADFLRAQGVKLNPSRAIFPQRIIKSKKESEAIREALKRTHTAFRTIEELLRSSTIKGNTLMREGTIVTSEYVKARVEQAMIEEDLLNVEGIVISCGPHAAIPHHRGSGPLRPHQTIICDIFPRYRGNHYFSDMTRTYLKGTPSKELMKLYAAVLEAQTKAIAMVRPGVRLSAVHEKCVEIFLKRGYHAGNKGFIHGTGHGLGLDVHEQPYVSKGQTGVFEEGHVVTVEPGLYYPKLGGVRLEDVVVVTKNGCENLTDYPKEFMIA